MAIDSPAPVNRTTDQPQANRGTALDLERILYCHGFASNFNPDKDKVRALSTLAPVDGVTVDYTMMPNAIFDDFAKAMTARQNSLIIGTSMGGFFAAWLGSELGLPFVAINPAIAPAKSLQKYIGGGSTHFGEPFVLSSDVVEAYSDLEFRLDGHGIIALDLGDEVIDARKTVQAVKNRLQLITFHGGSHRFDHMNALVPLIKKRFFTVVQKE
jgi:predicted esterase YcpF (UPF0227 family)